MKITNAFVIGVAAFVFAACSGNEKGDDSKEITKEGDIITVARNSPLSKRIRTATTVIQTYHVHFSTSCEVRAIPDKYSQVSAPFSGRIGRVFVKPGDTVAKGQVLFTLNSQDYISLCREYLDADSEYAQAKRALERAKRLHDGKMASDRELEDARADYNLKYQAMKNAAESLRVLGVNPATVHLGQPLSVRSPLAGKVVDMNLVSGQLLKEDSEAPVTVANLDKVWVVANVKEQDIHHIHLLEEAHITMLSMPDRTFIGKISYISDILNPETRTEEVVLECANPDGDLKPGMYGSIDFSEEPADGILVPKSALLQQEEKSYVLVDMGKGRYRLTNVVGGPETGDSVVIDKGLGAGSRIVVKGAFYFMDVK